MKFSEYTHSLFVPTSLNLIRVKPLRGTALCVFEPRLVFTVVDNFFGGDGRLPTKIEGREFTPTEMRVIQLLLRQVFADLQEAWSPVLGLAFDYLSRSAERRAGQEGVSTGRSLWSSYPSQKKTQPKLETQTCSPTT